MRYILAIALVIGCVLAGFCGEVTAQDSKNELDKKPANQTQKEITKKEIEALVDEHQRLFNKSDAEAISKQTVSAPLQLVRSSTHAVFVTSQDVEKLFFGMFTRLKEHGWKRSVKKRINIVMTGERLASVEYTFSRLDDEGKVMTTKTCVYIVQKLDEGWRIIGLHSSKAVKQPPFGKQLR